MKRLLATASLFIACIGCQQQVKEKPLTKTELVLREQKITQNRKWAWFKPLNKAAPFMERGGVWHIKEQTKLDDSTSTISFQNSEGTIRITTIVYNGLIFAYMVVIKHKDYNSQQLINMLTNEVPQDKQGNWVDEQNNAIISFGRQPNGEQIFYNIVYKDFYN